MQEKFYTSGISDKENATLIKIPPHSIEAEQAVLGGLLMNHAVWENISESVSEHDFYRLEHREIFHAIVILQEQDQVYDIVTVAEWLENHQKIDAVGGASYIAKLTAMTHGVSNINAYAKIIRNRSILRQLIQATNKISEDIFNPQGKTNAQILESAEKAIFAISEQESVRHKSYSFIKDLVVSAMEKIDELFHRDNHIIGVSSGFDSLDEKTAGLQAGELIVIAGRPSMGKTALAINIAEHAVIKEKLTVAVFSMEMPGESLAMRMLSSLARVDQQKIRTGRLQDADWPRLSSAVALLQDAKLFIDDTPALTPLEISTRCRRIHRDCKGIDLVVVDYLQLMQVSGTNENRATEISEISRSLKAMAKELNVPVIALSQLNRSLEQRPNKRPIMSDLRESGAIEQDADVIIFIYRDVVYNEDTEEKGKAEILIAKQRNGPIGMVPLTFLGQYTKFENYIPDNSFQRYDDGEYE